MLRNAILVGAAWVSMTAQSISGHSAPMRAGVARVDLTPPLEMKAILGGYGARMSQPAQGVHDALWAKALVLQQGDRRFALVTADVLAFPVRFKAAVMERLAPRTWALEQVLLLPSHSHTSLEMMALHPDNTFAIPQVGIFQRELYERTADLIAQVIFDAQRDLVEVRAGTGRTEVPNRNRNRRKGNSVHDPVLTVTRVDGVDGRPLAALVNWTAHPTFMHAEDMWFSGGWPGHLQRTLEALIGQDVTVLYYNGAEGDQSPVPPQGIQSHWEQAERYGREMGLQAWSVYRSIRPVTVSPFSFHTEHIVLPKRTWHPDFLTTGGAEYGLNEVMMREFVDRLLPTQSHSTALRFGDLLLVGVPGEMAASLGLELKSRLRSDGQSVQLTVGGLADEWISYILSGEEYDRGGYEASVSFYGPALGTVILNGATRAAARCLTDEGLRFNKSPSP